MPTSQVLSRKLQKNPTDRAYQIGQRLSNSWQLWLTDWNWMPWVLRLLGPFIFIILLLTFEPCLFNLFQGFFKDWIWAISWDQVTTVILLETLMAKIENQHYRPSTSFLPDHKPLTIIYQHEEALNINSTHLSFSFCIYSLGSGMKESYMAQYSRELKLP